MAQIGRLNRLTVTRVRDYGAHLDGGESGDILLPKRYVPEDCRPGDTVEVFVYVEGQNRLRATTRKPYAMVGQFAALRVKTNAASGSFLDWGLKKDLLVPKREQPVDMEEGRSYVVHVFLDEKTNRIAASAKLDRFLNLRPPEYAQDEEVDLLICSRTDLGYKAIVNNSHWGMLFKNEVFTELRPGRQLKGYIKRVRPDHKIDLVLQKPGYENVDQISRAILKTIKQHGGRIGVTDNTSPAEIYAVFGVSKKTFKKAIGALYKKRLVSLDPDGIRLTG